MRPEVSIEGLKKLSVSELDALLEYWHDQYYDNPQGSPPNRVANEKLNIIAKEYDRRDLVLPA